MTLPRHATPVQRVPPFLSAVLAPWFLDHAAARASVLPSLILGLSAAPIAFGLAVGARSRGGITRLLSLAPGLMVVTVLVAVMAFMCIPGGVWLRLSQRGRARLCAVLLAPGTLLLPIAAWATLAARATPPTAIVFLGSPVPPFPPASAIILASPVWPLGLALAAAINLVVALNRLNRMTFADDGHVCPACHYDLRGLPPGSPCPECGAADERTV
jgi:hypothetical protein